MDDGALAGLRVLELGAGISAAYGSKLLADLGADVIKVEPPGGDPLRDRGPFRDDRPDPNAAGLFAYLNANKRGAVLDLGDPRDVGRARELAAGADAVIENLGPGRLEALGLGLESLQELRPRIALVRISSFGQTGPYRDAPATDLVLQAAGGWVAGYNAPGRPPVRVGGRMPEYVAAAFAACATLTAVNAARSRGEAVEVDVSMLECLVGTLAYPMLLNEAMPEVRPGEREAREPRAPFGILPCKDGWVGVNILTEAHWANACRAIGAPEFAARRREVSSQRADYHAFQARLRPWLERHTAEEIADRCQQLRIPTAVVNDGGSLLECRQLEERGFFVDEPGGRFVQPGFPYRLSATPAALRRPAPELEAPGAECAGWRDRTAELPGFDAAPRVLDLGTFWAGPYAGMYLASRGADVIKVESVQRPDGFRFVGAIDQSREDWYEAGTLFQATNLGKRGVTLDLSREEGRALLLRLVETADVLIENFAPRVMERFGLDYARIRRARPDLVMVRMPAFGLEGPWRNYVGWAMAIAQAAGISALTGAPGDEGPRNPGAFIDPAVGMHAMVAIQAALAHRRRTGEGQQIEMAQLETAVCMCPDPVLDRSLRARTLRATGNRTPGRAPEGVYACAGDGHVAVSVRDARDWRRLVAALGAPAWARDDGLASARGREARADELDQRIGAWCRGRSAADAAALLRARGLPAAEVLVASAMYGEPQLEARGYYQTLHHPVTGARRYPGWPMRFSFAPGDPHPGPTPTLGQHNDEVLGGELGVSAAELDGLRKDRVIGQRWKP